jgi:Nitroreductase
MKIEINQTRCIKCLRCVRVCPAHIFYLNKETKEVQTQKEESCISCGHCAAACLDRAVVHELFPEEKIHQVDRSLLPTPEQMDLLIKVRRSNRAFTSQPVPREYLEQILEAAYRTPTASNEQELKFIITSNPDKIRAISQITLDYFGALIKKLKPLMPIVKHILPREVKMIPQFEAMQKEFEKGNDLILRGATTVLFIYTHKKARFGIQDANLAYQNASLMAESLGISQFYTGFVYNAIKNDKKHRIEKLLGIEGTIYAGMGLGMPAFLFEQYPDKKPADIRWV